MSRLILAAVLLLAACAAKPPAGSAFRAADAPIWSAAAFLPAQAAGTWRQVADFQPAGASCGAGGVEITPEAQGLRLNGSLCLAGVARDVSGLAVPTGPGRLSVAGQDWWVLWVDTGYRTMAIGTPSGRFGFILDRGAIPGDRLNAAREIFDFNGYRTDGLTAL
ncbi:lipocalin family protein [Rhodobacter sp. SY28-1]|uniref:lipocalin family protein n=1 Tax=Rhodobacter sp. SY28-1 TaxID=2562317 RepID=UPI0010BFEAA8|nr:lipocalin family protein [Rhodobacter sp. SY28-1]